MEFICSPPGETKLARRTAQRPACVARHRLGRRRRHAMGEDAWALGGGEVRQLQEFGLDFPIDSGRPVNSAARRNKRDYSRKEIDQIGAFFFTQPPFKNPKEDATCLVSSPPARRPRRTPPHAHRRTETPPTLRKSAPRAVNSPTTWPTSSLT